MAEYVALDVDEGVGTIRLDRPKMNALDAKLRAELSEAVSEAGRRDDVKAVVIWGGPKIFAAGADVVEMAPMDPATAEERVHALQDTFDMVAALPKVTIAAITGYALGGGFELCLAADLRYMADSAKVGLPEIGLGIIPGAGGTQRLPRLIGVARAKQLIYTGRMVRADEALAFGMVDKVFPAKEVYDRAVEDARAFASGPVVALAAAKAAIDRGIEATTLTEGQAIEREVFGPLFATEDQKEGMRSLLEDGPGKAVFKGR